MSGAAHAPAPKATLVPSAPVAAPQPTPPSTSDAVLSVQALPMLGETPAPQVTPAPISSEEAAPISPEELSKATSTKRKPAAPARSPVVAPHPVAAPHPVVAPTK